MSTRFEVEVGELRAEAISGAHDKVVFFVRDTRHGANLAILLAALELGGLVRIVTPDGEDLILEQSREALLRSLRRSARRKKRDGGGS